MNPKLVAPQYHGKVAEDEIYCPWCKKVCDNLVDTCVGGKSDHEEICSGGLVCNHCGKQFDVYRKIEISFSWNSKGVIPKDPRSIIPVPYKKALKRNGFVVSPAPSNSSWWVYFHPKYLWQIGRSSIDDKYYILGKTLKHVLDNLPDLVYNTVIELQVQWAENPPIDLNEPRSTLRERINCLMSLRDDLTSK